MKTVKELIRLTREARVSLFLWGIHGIGKSAAVRQTAAELGIQFIEFRCAQIEASDLRGLPDKGSDGRTHFLARILFPQGSRVSCPIFVANGTLMRRWVGKSSVFTQKMMSGNTRPGQRPPLVGNSIGKSIC